LGAWRVHPCVGGGDVIAENRKTSRTGPSPRGRGRPQPLTIPCPHPGSIPAWAGETGRPTSGPRARRVHPRVGGGDQLLDRLGVLERGPSPRGRGRRPSSYPDTMGAGSIPAWAGETTRSAAPRWCRRVHPRVGGGDCGNVPLATWRGGPSPRGRGRQPKDSRLEAVGGSIPAWAGETGEDATGGYFYWVHPRVGGGDNPANDVLMRRPGPSPRGRGRLRSA